MHSSTQVQFLVLRVVTPKRTLLDTVADCVTKQHGAHILLSAITIYGTHTTTTCFVLCQDADNSFPGM